MLFIFYEKLTFIYISHHETQYRICSIFKVGVDSSYITLKVWNFLNEI